MKVHGIKEDRLHLIQIELIIYIKTSPPNQRLKLHYGDLTDAMNLTRIIEECQPDEIYNLGAMSQLRCPLILQNMLEMWMVWEH